MAMLQV